MECRMQVVERRDGCTVHLAGRLHAGQVAELRALCAAAGGHLQIDLTDLVSADAVGIDALRRLRADGVELVGVARYLRKQLVS
jgi:hypothetical protein